LIERTVGEAAGDLARAFANREQDPRGLLQLRRALAERYTAGGLPTTPAHLLLTHGVRHAWNLLLRLRVRPGQPVLLESPCQPGALDAVRLHGGRPWPAPVAEDGWPLDATAAALRRARAQLALLSPDFQQPSGQLMPAEAREFLVHTAQRAGTLLVADQSWDELALDVPGLPPSLASWGAPESVVLIGSARAVLGDGLQVGWIRAAPALVHRLALSSAAHGAGSAVADQVITLRLLPHWAALRAHRQAELTARRAVLAAELADRLPGWRFTPPPGGPALWVDLGAPVSTALAGLAENHGVRLLSGPRHGVGGAFDNRLRLPYTLPEPALRAGVHRLAEAVAELGPV
jgi:DNA-binding transcriptional MocR family regulator